MIMADPPGSNQDYRPEMRIAVGGEMVEWHSVENAMLYDSSLAEAVVAWLRATRALDRQIHSAAPQSVAPWALLPPKPVTRNR